MSLADDTCLLNQTQLQAEEGCKACFLLLFLPLCTILGNTLVIIAVCTEKHLKTSTNFLLVSLASADLTVAALVMPFSIYMLMNNLYWYLGYRFCNLFIVVDVIASTASIVHLMAISVDRFYAVFWHMDYRAQTHRNFVLISIPCLWLFSIALGMPLGISLRESEASRAECFTCSLDNPYFMLYGSVFAFYIPCVVMLVMYSFVFVKLRQRIRSVRLQEYAAGHMVSFGQNLDSLIVKAHTTNAAKTAHDLRKDALNWTMPYLKQLQADIDSDSEGISTHDIVELTNILKILESGPAVGTKRVSTCAAPSATPLVMIPEEETLQGSDTVQKDSSERIIKNDVRKMERRPASSDLSFIPAVTLKAPKSEGKDRRSSHGIHAQFRRSVVEAYIDKKRTSLTESQLGQRLSAVGILPPQADKFQRKQSLHRATQKFKSMKGRAMELLMRMMSKQGHHLRKEARATKLVVAVMITFLICYIPFFTMNLVKVYALWYSPDGWTETKARTFLIFSWLGYINSCINPIIYSVINRKFRVAFRRILRIPGADRDAGRRSRLFAQHKPSFNVVAASACQMAGHPSQFDGNSVTRANSVTNNEISIPVIPPVRPDLTQPDVSQPSALSQSVIPPTRSNQTEIPLRLSSSSSSRSKPLPSRTYLDEQSMTSDDIFI